MRLSKKFTEGNTDIVMNRTIKRGKFKINETIQLPSINFDQLETKKHGFSKIQKVPALNLGNLPVNLPSDKVKTEREAMTERVRSSRISQGKVKQIGSSKSNDQKKLEQINLPPIQQKNHSLVLSDVKRKRSNTHCKIVVPKNCPFPFSNKIKKVKQTTTKTNDDQIDFLGLDLDLSRISQIQEPNLNVNRVQRLYSRDSIQEIPIF